ncbi:8828_t:CDS:2 [Scutellospora calospora]|uniref:8828_t:CDS:1 n=1 Tax=Scutellospora calospora TaxID=85575 RepID=A0ACA9KVP0_9GLOM|nr:8828_t:CDS:2 [Scutellospora calospora]
MRASFLLTLFLTVFVSAAPVVEIRDDTQITSNILAPFTILDKTAQPVTRQITFNLAPIQMAPDGYSRTLYAVNGQYPGPMIRCNKGDQLVITVKNELGVYTTVHWHGLFQLGTTWYDGVPGVSQCLIPHQSNFVYNFTTAGQSGTYWWHAHYMAQYLDGLLGALIIHDHEDPYLTAYDYEYVVTLTDWYHQSSSQLLSQFLTPGYNGSNVTAPSSDCKSNSELAVYKVTKGKKYRFRLINTSAQAAFIFSIDNHPMKVIEVDGIIVKSFEINRISMHVAQRYSVIIDANNDVKNYWIRATLSPECIPHSNTTINFNSAINYNVTAILSYDGADNKDPETNAFTDFVRPCRNLNNSLIKPYFESKLSDKIVDTSSYNVTFGTTANKVKAAFINNSSYVSDFNSPTDIKVITYDIDAKTLPTSQNIKEYDDSLYGGVAEIIVYNSNQANHPFHFHGRTFYLVGEGENGTKVDESTFNLVDPPIRDTTVVPAGGWTVIRFILNNPGIWVFHCHIEWHIELGMLIQTVESPKALQTLKVPDNVKALCSNYGT